MNETENQKENFRQRCAVLQDENASEGFTVPMEETATKKRGNKKTRIALVIALSLVLLAVIALGGVSVYYRSAFLPGTVINGWASVSSTSIPLPAPARYRHAPPRPESAPAMTMESTMLRVSLMPAYRAASRL